MMPDKRIKAEDTYRTVPAELAWSEAEAIIP